MLRGCRQFRYSGSETDMPLSLLAINTSPRFRETAWLGELACRRCRPHHIQLTSPPHALTSRQLRCAVNRALVAKEQPRRCDRIERQLRSRDREWVKSVHAGPRMPYTTVG